MQFPIGNRSLSELQSFLLGKIDEKLGTEKTELYQAFSGKLGAGEGGFLKSFGELFTKSGHIVRGAINADSYVVEFEGKTYELTDQQIGTRILSSMQLQNYR